MEMDTLFAVTPPRQPHGQHLADPRSASASGWLYVARLDRVDYIRYETAEARRDPRGTVL